MSDENKSLAIRQKWETILVPEMQKLMGDDTQAMVRVILTAMNKTPTLANCTAQSVMAACLDLGTLKLLPNTPQQHAYLIPRRLDDQLQCNLEIGYRGYCALAYRTGSVIDIDGNVIREGDEIDYREGTDGFVHFKRKLGAGRSMKAILGCYVTIKLQSGADHVKVLDADQLEGFRQAMIRQNRGKETPAWKFFPEEMYLKSAFKRVAKLLPLGEFVEKAVAIERRHEEKVANATVREVAPQTYQFADQAALPEPGPKLEATAEGKAIESSMDKFVENVRARAEGVK